MNVESTVARMIVGVLERRAALLAALTEVATWHSAADEVHRTVRVLAGAPWEIQRNRPRTLSRLATFLPSNNVLYSYALFGMVPSLYTEQVIARPSARVRAVGQRVHEILADLTDGRITLTGASQREFIQFGACADAVLFTGQPENAAQVMAAVGSRPTVLAFGSGPNPFVVGPEADLDRAAGDLVAARLYNSGQDCLCPDVTFVHHSVAERFVKQLCALTADLSVGDRRDPATRIAPLVYDDAVRQAAEFLDEHRPYVRQGGKVDLAGGVVEPSVVQLPWRPEFRPPEHFSPVFSVVSYDGLEQLRSWFTNPAEVTRGMYASVFGEPGLPGDRIGTTVIARDRTTFDVEDGNQPFGGFGPLGGCVQADGVVTGRPLLLSAEVASR
jgi:acyl-CoA reductase-like NAD-dependent aldehyde dehydrogenase